MNNRNKKSISYLIIGLMLLSTSAGAASVTIFSDGSTEVDVELDNFRVGTLDKLGLGYEAAKERNPGILYTSISDFGFWVGCPVS